MVNTNFLKTFSLKRRILLPLALALVLLLIVFVVSVYHPLHRQVHDAFINRLTTINQLFYRALISDGELLSAIADKLLEDQQMQAAWQANDRDALLKITSPILTELRDRYRVTHFYFHDLEGINFLRVHKPNKRGDLIGRFTMLEAKKTGSPSIGIELGPLGTFTLRAVHPWRVNNQLIGYIEIGEEIDHIIKKIYQTLDVELCVAIHKKYLDKGVWQNGMRMLGHVSKWNQFPSSVIVSQTFKAIPQIFGDFLSEEDHVPLEMVPGFEAPVMNRLYQGGFVPLYDVAEVEVGDIVVLYDITSQIGHARNQILVFSMIFTVVGVVLFWLFSIILGQTETELNRHQDLIKKHAAKLTITNEQLQQEIVDRRQAEEELINYRNHLEKLVGERTANLTEANEGLKREIDKRKGLEKKLKESSITDELTKLLNRRGFLTLADKQLKIADRIKKELFLLYIDLDNLKWINDKLGHQMGDLALVETADVLNKMFRKADVIGRLGGDEFAVMLNKANRNDDDPLAKRLEKNIKICNAQEGRSYQLSLSYGLVRYNPHAPRSIDELISQADTSMYECKKEKKKLKLIKKGG